MIHRKYILFIALLLGHQTAFAKTPANAIQTIANYTVQGTTPTLSDYLDAGIVHISQRNLDAVNEKIKTHTKSEVDTQQKIQAVVDDYNIMLHGVLSIITNYILTGDTPINLAEAGNTQVKYDGDTITLDGSASANNGTITSYAWTLTSSSPAGVNVTINNANSAIAAFVAPAVSETTQLTFTLTVTNENNKTYSDTVTITIKAQELIINEISAAYYYYSYRWFEIYNPSSHDVNLSKYTLRSSAYDHINYTNSFVFALPNHIIAAKDYVIVKSNFGPAFNTTMDAIENAHEILLKDSASNKYPVWFSDVGGYLELLKNGKTIDFVTIVDDKTRPTTDGAWFGKAVPAFSHSGTEDWKSIARDTTSSDTNTQNDWTQRDFPTYAAVNDVTCNDDADADGIPDCSEVAGSHYAGMDLYAYGARTNQKDIFVEVDYIDSTNNGTRTLDEGVVPQKEALEKVVSAFAANGYVLHFDVGNLFSNNGSAIDPSQMDFNGGNQLPYAAHVNFGAINGAKDFREYKITHMKTPRKQIFHYMVFGTTQEADGSAGSSGVAELPGNDVLITLGSWGLSTATTRDSHLLINYQAGTVMHEFGHNLGLLHGGDNNRNHKPNYLSIMNYLYQLSGLPTIGNNEGDRYKNTYCGGSTLTNPATGAPADFKIDYSHGSGGTLSETGTIDESLGLRYPNSEPIDFNCNNHNSDALSHFNVNHDGRNNTLHDYNDWGHIDIVFAKQYNGNAGNTKTAHKQLSVNPFFNDNQPFIREEVIKRPEYK